MARSLSYMMMRGFSGEEIKRFEMFLIRRLSGEIDTPTFIDFLDSPFKDGGIGLWKQRARKIAFTIEELIEKRKKIEDVYRELEKDPETPLYEEVSKMRAFLLEDYSGILSDIQIARFDEAVEDRFRNIISPENFRQVLELSRTDFGVGLAPNTVRMASERLETILTGKNYQVFH